MPVDPRIAPPMFLRADRFDESYPTETEADPTADFGFDPEGETFAVDTTPGSVRAAFLGYAESQLTAGMRAPNGSRYETPAGVAHRHLRDRGFSEDEIRTLRFGLYSNPRDVHAYLKQLGFTEETIRRSGLVQDVDGRPRHDWSGNVIVPVFDADGSPIDVFAFDPRDPADARFLHGPDATDVAAYGLHEARSTVDGERLVLVENVVDAMYLRRRGLPNVAATGCPPARFTPQRWRNLVRAGVRSVTLAFNRDLGRERRIHDVLAHALTARVTPAVYVVDAHDLHDTTSAAESVLRHGAESMRRAVRSAPRAFDGKDYGPRETPRAEPEPRADWRFAPQRYVHGRHLAFLEAEVDKIVNPGERAAWRSFLADVDSALRLGEYARARAITDDWYARLHRTETPVPTTVSLAHAVDAIRRETTRDAVEFDDPRFAVGTEESVETIEVATRSARLATTAARLARSIDEDSEGLHVVVRSEFTEREITLALVAHLTNLASDGPGLGYDAVWSRLSGHDPREGYEDRPWLVDDAVDRLADVDVRFVEREGTIDGFETEVATILIDAGRPGTEEHAVASALAARFECPVTIVREPSAETPRRAYVPSAEYRYETDWSNWHVADRVTSFRLSDRAGFESVLRDWIAGEESFDVRR